MATLSHSAYVYCMSCRDTIEPSFKEQCTDCYNAKNLTRRYHPVTGVVLETPYQYSGQLFKLDDTIPSDFGSFPHSSLTLACTTDFTTAIPVVPCVLDRELPLVTLPMPQTEQVQPNIKKYGNPADAMVEFPCGETSEGDEKKIDEVLNILFLFDITGSMGPFINGAKDNIKTIIPTTIANLEKTLSEKYNTKNITIHPRISIVGYRDFTDVQHFEFVDFTNDINSIHATLSVFRACGGGDAPEDIFGAFKLAMNPEHLHWNFSEKESSKYMHTTNIITLITDAPAHGAFANGGQSDSYLNSETEKDWIDMMTQIKSQNIDLSVIQLTSMMKDTVQFIKKNYDDDRYKLNLTDQSHLEHQSMAYRSCEMSCGVGAGLSACAVASAVRR